MTCNAIGLFVPGHTARAELADDEVSAVLVSKVKTRTGRVDARSLGIGVFTDACYCRRFGREYVLRVELVLTMTAEDYEIVIENSAVVKIGDFFCGSRNEDSVGVRKGGGRLVPDVFIISRRLHTEQVFGDE